MNGPNFLYSLSSALSEHFLVTLRSQSHPVSQKTIKARGKGTFGSIKETKCLVEDYVISISFGDFAKIVDQCQASEVESSCLMSYEACLNPASSRQTRSGSSAETNQFEQAREDDNDLKKVYDSVSSKEVKLN